MICAMGASINHVRFARGDGRGGGGGYLKTSRSITWGKRVSQVISRVFFIGKFIFNTE